MNRGSLSASDDDPLGPVLESFLDRFRRGERPALTDFIARHPDLAGPIRELIPALVELEELGGSTGSLGLPPGSRPGTGGSGRDGLVPERLGDYLILRQVGGGGMGVVYEARRESLKSRVALKVMHPRFRADPRYLRRFHVEARLAAGLHHTNIVGVFDYGEQDGVCYYAMQFIQGQPLDLVLADIHRLRDEGTWATGPLGPEAIRTIAAPARSPAASGAVEGLLTGRYAVPTVAVPSPGADGPATVAIAAHGPESSGPAGSSSVGKAPEPTAVGESSMIGPSSLGGSGELRYFREIARVGAQVADALEYAHRRNVLHRDIKPSNLLLDALGNVWVTDFGLAKLEEGDDLTQSRDLVGTLRYMAPERFRGASDRRGDIYSLGATLYELLTLQPPFQEADQLRLIDRIRDDAPTPPRQVDRNIPRDLETIVLKALAKDPKDRFATASELAGELRRFVEGRPIRSRPVTFVERFWRWCKRDPLLAGASIAAAVLTTALALGGTWAAFVFRAQRDHISDNYDRIRRAEAQTRENLFKSLLAQARATRYGRQVGQRFDALAALERAAAIARQLGLPREQLDPLRDEAIACLALPDLRPVGPRMTVPPGVIATAFDRSMTRYALRSRDGTIMVRRVADDGEIARFQARGDREFWVFDFSPDGRYLETTHFPGHALTVWDVDRRAVAVDEPGPIAPTSARFSPDSRSIALGRRGELLVYDLTTGRPARRWPGNATGLAFRRDGAQIAVIDNRAKPPTCRIRRAESGGLVREFPLRAPADDVAWDPGGGTLATTTNWPDSKIELWDTATGVRRAILEGHDNGGLRVSFHPAGTLLASNGYEGRLRLWDPIQGRPLLSVTSSFGPGLSRDGRIVVGQEDKLTAYEVEPALEYRTFAHASSEPINYARPSIRHDGRILAVGTDHGAAIWDLARGTELAFLTIGNAWHLLFEPSGDLITSGDVGVQRWPVRLDAGRGEFRIGPPRRLTLPVSHGGIDQDRSGRIVAVAAKTHAVIATPERTISVGPLDDCRGVAVSPDGRWLVTSSHARDAQVWRIADGTKEVDLSVDFPVGKPNFSPDGKWLTMGGGRIWEVGTWRERPSIRGGAGFSPDGRWMVVVEPSRIIRLVEFGTGRTLARLESPDLCGVGSVAFSPDGSHLVTTTNDRPAPAAHVWGLHAIRKDLARMDLDWDAPAPPEDDPTDPSAPSLPAPRVDYGPLKEHLQHYNEAPQSLLRRYTERLKGDPNDADAHHHRAHALAKLRRVPEALADCDQAIRLRPGDSHLRDLRGRFLLALRRYEDAIADLEAAVASDQPIAGQDLALACNNAAWDLAKGPDPTGDLARALKLAERAVALVSDEGTFLNTMGVVLYRLGRYDDAIAMLERSRAAHHDRPDGFDLFFLAMAHQRLGHHEPARDSFERAVRWMQQSHDLGAQSIRELTAFRAEAEAVLAGDLPADVFAPTR